MLTLVRLSATLKICMYAGDHNPPHFHLVGAGFAFQVCLDNLQVLRGTATKDAFSRAVAWAEETGDLLARKWAEFNDRD